MRRLLFILIIVSSIVCGVVLTARSATGPKFLRRLSQTVLGRSPLPGERPEGAAPDSLSQAELLRRMSQIYRYHAEALAAEASGRQEAMEPILQRSLSELQALSVQPGILENDRFRELFRTVVTEYEKYFGLPADTLAVERGEIFALRDEVFTALNDLQDPLLEDVRIPALSPVQTTVPMTVNRLVEQSIRFLVRNPERNLNTWMSRSETYFAMIEQVFREEGVPDELKYLALIESGLNPKARSWAQAVGMWQFLAGTGRENGLRVDQWMDERMDPEASTRAAARYLTTLYQTFDDWHLALAAYNCGPGNVRRAIRRSGDRTPTFWSIYPHLPRETRNYVPMYIAAALVASNPQAFGVAPVQPGPLYAYDTVPVHALLPLQTVAEMAGTDVATISALNPALRRASLPPGDRVYRVRIPHGTYEQFMQRYATDTGAGQQFVVRQHVVRRGDSPGSVARRYSIEPEALLAANGLGTELLRVGQRLNVPVVRPQEKDAPAAAALADATPQRVFYGPRSRRPIAAGTVELPVQPPETRPRPAPQPAPQPALAAAAPAPAATPERSVRAEPKPAPVRQAATRVTYSVRRGDTLGKIARRNGVSVRSLMQWNSLRSSRIQPGQRLTIHRGKAAPQAKKASTAKKRSRYVTYRVRRGDTLHRIGRNHGVTVASLQRWNGLRSNRIQAGQRLRIYR